MEINSWIERYTTSTELLFKKSFNFVFFAEQNNNRRCICQRIIRNIINNSGRLAERIPIRFGYGCLTQVSKNYKKTMNQHSKITKTVFNVLITGLIVLWFPLTLKAQLFETNELYSNTKVIKGKYYNGTGGGGYWSLYYVDSIGRIIRKESYHKKQLMSRQKIVYDENNNKIFDIQTFDYNNPERTDTFRFEYKYADNRIIYQFRKLSENDSTVTELIENQGDTLLKYQEQAFYYRPKTKKTDVLKTVYTLRYQNGLLISNEKYDQQNNANELLKYEYFGNSRLKRRLIERIPEPKIKEVYIGGTGSDDEFYNYKLDSEGRIKVFYRIINGKKYKIAVYCYE
jgi:hypothetical protein